ncbi:MAG: biotin--[acetyl-CoA-carboxylase] ligase [Candidatus Omnitrophica bacterium]|nr:biotin--[acetyl-CoA-carboxylase] ligase [Candidatus Omnitrophota bacterium]
MEEKILRLFKRDPDTHLSGEDISSKLDISRSALWKHIEKLRNLGYEFDAVPHLGYRLSKVPDKLYAYEISHGLKTDRFGKEVVYYDRVGSTNNIAYDLAQKGAKEGTVVIAEAQNKGRGRLSREWVSPKHKGIYMSVILRPEIAPFQASKITLTSAVSVATAIRDETGIPAVIKWPNDIFVDAKKVSGILTEMEAECDSVKFLVLGIGINCNTKLSELPKGAGSLLAAGGEAVSRVGLTRTILEKLEQNYKLFTKEGFSPMITEWRNLSTTLGKRVRATCMHKKIEGEAMDIDSDGALIVRLDNGFRERILAGDLTLLR